MNGTTMGLNNMTQVIEKTVSMLLMLESGFPLTDRLFDPSTWSKVLVQLYQPAMLEIK